MPCSMTIPVCWCSLSGMGVGFAAVIGTLRFLYSWSMKPVIFCYPDPHPGVNHLRDGEPVTCPMCWGWPGIAVRLRQARLRSRWCCLLGLGIAVCSRKGQLVTVGLWHRHTGLPVSDYRGAQSGHLSLLGGPGRRNNRQCQPDSRG